jgi:acyl dehydratase
VQQRGLSGLRSPVPPPTGNHARRAAPAAKEGATISHSDTLSGPWFEDFRRGDVFDDAPAVTLTEGHAALHQAMFGDRSRLPLDVELSRRVTGSARPLVHSCLVANLAIGQSTQASQRVLGNLFYRGLAFRAPVFQGDTLRTVTRVVGLRQNRVRQGRPATGMVALEMEVTNQRGESVLRFWRCPMIPCRDPGAVTGHDDAFTELPESLDLAAVAAALPPWDLAPLAAFGGTHFQTLRPGDVLEPEAADTVTLAPELVRLTLNMAMTHTDRTRSVYGRRLVYGGHTISMAAAAVSRALPNVIGIVGWRSCDHLAPVFEEDILRSRITVGDRHPLARGGLVALRVEVRAERAGEDARTPVLDWHLLAWFA